MKIAILGTKGIPNNYGGYEQFAEYISTRLVEKGHSVTVYNPHFHKFRENEFNGVRIIRKYSPESYLGGAANIVYDHLCLKDALNRDFDVIYEAGYHSVALSFKWLKVRKLKKPVIVTNMDGLEWKRSKWSKVVQRVIKLLEKIAVKESPYLISDNLGIQDYLNTKFGVSSYYIPYGADPVTKFDESFVTTYNVQKGQYFMLVARLEPENNVEVIMKAHLRANTTLPLLVVGNYKTMFGIYLKNSYESATIRFVGGIYVKSELDSLRHYATGYFHGHSVGGTNPSLLEAMASQAFIIAHKNPFNETILGKSALYFENENDVFSLIENVDSLSAKSRTQFLSDNLAKIRELYNWDYIVRQHEELFTKWIEENGLKVAK